MAEKTVWELTMDALESTNVFSPGTKEGECTEAYCVLKHDGGNKISGISSEVQYYTILCYVPRAKYSSLRPFVDSCKEVMKTLYPMLIPTGSETPSFYDDTYKAHMISVMYRNNVRNTQL